MNKLRFSLMLFYLGMSTMGAWPSIAPSFPTAAAQPPPGIDKSLSTGKSWPLMPLRGLNTKLVLPASRNLVPSEEYLSEAFFCKLNEWKVNVIRAPISVDPKGKWDVQKGAQLPVVPGRDPMAPYRRHLKGLRIALELASKHNIYVILSAGNIAGRKIDVLYRESDGRGYYQGLIDLWTHVASTFGNHPNLLAYDLLNEPVEKKGEDSWQNKVLPNLVKRIRSLDKETFLMVEAAPWGSAKALSRLTPVNDSKTVYSFHFYAPHNYTHQGIRNLPRGLVYPGILQRYRNSESIYWDKAMLEKELQNAIRFQKQFNVRIVIGEFGVLRWAKGASDWLSDVISIFEQQGWDWCFHSYGGWNGWNPTFSADAPPKGETDGGQDTEMLRVLKNAWGKNSVPGRVTAK